MNNLDQLEKSVIHWAEDKGIFSKATPYKQAQKTLEECGELLYAIGLSDMATDKAGHNTANEAIQDAIGDVCVTIIIQAHMQGLTLTDCLQSAYDVIKNRTGKMRDGQFHKDN